MKASPLLFDFCFFFLFTSQLFSINSLSIDETCRLCRSMHKQFVKGLHATEHQNYGGGNTAWEEKSLGNWATSETRLVQFLDKLCDDTENMTRFLCGSLLEKYEEDIESWWYKKFPEIKSSEVEPTFFTYLCVELMKSCCPSNHYGPDCLSCMGYPKNSEEIKQSLCSGHGECDGNGNRTGTGKCVCNKGYSGEFCQLCNEDHYRGEKSSNKEFYCLPCHASCSSCSADGPENCYECKSGYSKEGGICIDIDECAALDKESGESTSPCTASPAEYCVNTDGSFNCEKCDVSCGSCIGPGPDKCLQCSVGYIYRPTSDGVKICEDMDECSIDKSLCSGPNESCFNLPGSYECRCKSGYSRSNKNDPKSSCLPQKQLSNDANKAHNRNQMNKDKKDGAGVKSRKTHYTSDRKKQQKHRTIWTVEFTKEVAFLVLLGLICSILYRLFQGNLFILLVICSVLFYYIYTTSTRLDAIYRNQ